MSQVKTKIEELVIEGITYVPKDSKTNLVNNTDGLPFVIIRTYSVGVHMGYLKKRESTLAGIEVELVNSRRLWKWSGALTLSNLAVDGTSNPKDCKFPLEIPSISLVAIEIIPVTEKAFKSLTSVPVWTL